MEGDTERPVAMSVKRPCQTPGCTRAVHQQRQTARFCVLCREARNRALACERSAAARRGIRLPDRRRYEPDLTAAQIEAKLAAGDAAIKRTRARLA